MQYSNYLKMIKSLNEIQVSETDIVAGVDEVGRGPLAGPVIAAAVILNPSKPINNLCDSKKISSKKRLLLSEKIKMHSIAWSLGRAEVYEIDKLNILQASLLAMRRAIDTLAVRPDIVLVDGQYTPNISMKKIAIIKGDSFIPAISAASIIAKIERDSEMIALDKIYPGYGFSSHKGYPTKQHIQSLKKLGITKIHRCSFSPVAKYII